MQLSETEAQQLEAILDRYDHHPADRKSTRSELQSRE